MFSRSNLFWFSSISGNSMPYISCSKSGSVSGFLVLSHSFQNVQSCTRNHSVPQITVSVVRQAAHNMHTACITSCIHVTKNSNNAFTTAGFTPCLAHAIITCSGFVTRQKSDDLIVQEKAICPTYRNYMAVSAPPPPPPSKQNKTNKQTNKQTI